MPDFAGLHRHRQQHPHLTQQLLWEEYRQANQHGYRYFRFDVDSKRFEHWDLLQPVPKTPSNANTTSPDG